MAGQLRGGSRPNSDLAASSKPLAGQEIWIGTQQWDWGSPLATGKTGTDGSFSITLPAQLLGATLYVGTTNNSDLTAVEKPLQLNVVNPTVISGLKATLNQYWTLSVSGCLGFPSGNTTQRFCHTSGLTVQYASSASGPWKNLFAINGNESAANCGTGGIKFTGSHVAAVNYAYYRAGLPRARLRAPVPLEVQCTMACAPPLQVVFSLAPRGDRGMRRGTALAGRGAGHGLSPRWRPRGRCRRPPRSRLARSGSAPPWAAAA